MEQKGKRGEELLNVFKQYDLGRKKFKILTGKDYRMFFYVMKFYDEKDRITPSQKRELKEVLKALKQVTDYNVEIPIKELRKFLKSVEVETKGPKGK